MALLGGFADTYEKRLIWREVTLIAVPVASGARRCGVFLNIMGSFEVL